MIGDLAEFGGLLTRPRLSPTDLEELRVRKLRAVVPHAYQTVPYYRELFRGAGLLPEDIRAVRDLERVPVTTKEAMRSAGAQNTTARGADLTACFTPRTNGTTGEPFTVYISPREARTRRLVELRALRSIGFRPRDRLMVLGPERPHRVRLHQRLGLYETELVSAEVPVDEQIRRLREFQPTVLWAYPTILRALLHRIDGRLSDLVRPRILITSAEVFDEVLKEQVRADFEGEIYNSYGAIEVGRIGIECPAHEGLHVTADQLIVECVEGVVVVTSFGARVMPMIRYRLGDLATPIKEPCSCGAPFPLLRAPSGRDNDMIRLPSGKLLSPIGLQFILRRLPGVDQFRFVQERTDHIVLLIASRAKPSAEALSDLRLRLLAYCQEPLHMEIQLVDFIEGDRPKFKSFVSRLGSGDGAEPRSAG